MVELATLDYLSIFALLMVVVIGLPHGALDGAVAMHLGVGRSINAILKFLASYLLCAIFVIIIWYNFPDLSLVVFLIISMIHFGWGDANSNLRSQFFLQIVSHGGIVTFGIVYFHVDEVLPIFDMLTQNNSYFVIQFSKFIFYIISFFTFIYFTLIFRNQALRLRFLELIFVWLIVIFVPPLLSFAVYFCFVHTARHIRNIWNELKIKINPKIIISQAIILTIASWIFGIFALYYIDSGDFDSDIIRVIFIGLAALTVPHMILVDGFFRKKLLSKYR